MVYAKEKGVEVEGCCGFDSFVQQSFELFFRQSSAKDFQSQLPVVED